TQQGKDSYPIYRRRDDGQIVEVRNAKLDNRWVVSYNPTLLMRYNCHINVKIACSIKSVKYLYKYIYKGHDRASFSVDKSENDDIVINEIKQYQDARCITPSEVAYMLYRFPLYYVSPPVLQLAVHLEGMHMVSFKSTSDLNEVAKDPKNQRSMVTEWFKTNVEEPEARKFLYIEFSDWFTWKKPQNVGSGENNEHKLVVLYMQTHLKGNGLLLFDSYLDDTLTECAMSKMPSSLRQMFAIIMVFSEPNNILKLWEKHFNSLSKDFRRTIFDSHEVQQRDLDGFGLPKLDENRELNEDYALGFDEDHLKIVQTLNAELRARFDEIMDNVTSEKGRGFFVDGPGGTGKIYLYKALIATVRSMGLIAVATIATSEIAASIMPGGHTAHSRFKIPIKIAN
ncbi:hypothetical protein EJB05_22589, partial [Eragrostis curvula]